MLFSVHHQGITIMRQTAKFVFEPLITNLVERNAVVKRAAINSAFFA